jgi:YD repeat-containing protein
MCAQLLVSASNTAATSVGTLAWTYDPNGNRQSETRDAGTMPYVYSQSGCQHKSTVPADGPSQAEAAG